MINTVFLYKILKNRNLLIKVLSRWIFLLILFFLPFQLSKHFVVDNFLILGKTVDYFIPFFYLEDILVIFFILIGVFYVLFDKQKKIDFPRILIAFIPVFLSLFLLFLNQTRLLELNFLVKWVRLVEWSLFFLFCFLESDWLFEWSKVIVIFSLNSFIVSVILIGEFVFQKSVGFGLLGEWKFDNSTSTLATLFFNGYKIIRPRGTFPHPNLAAFFMAFFSTLNILSFKFTKRKLFLVVFFVNMISLILTFSRVGLILLFINMLVTFLYIVVIEKKSILMWNRKKIFWFLGGVIVVGILVVPILVSRFSSLFADDYSSIERRLYLNNVAFGFIKSHLLSGIGLNNFIVLLTEDLSYFRYSFLQPVHNFYLLFLSENGLISFFLIGILLFNGFFRQLLAFLKKQNDFVHLSLIIFFIDFFIAGFFDHYFYSLYQGNLVVLLFVFFSLIL